MRPYRLTQRARRELDEAVGYRSARHFAAGERLMLEFISTFSMLGRFPGLGRVRPDLTSQPVLFFPVDKFHIICRADILPL